MFRCMKYIAKATYFVLLRWYLKSAVLLYIKYDTLILIFFLLGIIICYHLIYILFIPTTDRMHFFYFYVPNNWFKANFYFTSTFLCLKITLLAVLQLCLVLIPNHNLSNLYFLRISILKIKSMFCKSNSYKFLKSYILYFKSYV